MRRPTHFGFHPSPERISERKSRRIRVPTATLPATVFPESFIALIPNLIHNRWTEQLILGQLFIAAGNSLKIKDRAIRKAEIARNHHEENLPAIC